MQRKGSMARELPPPDILSMGTKGAVYWLYKLWSSLAEQTAAHPKDQTKAGAKAGLGHHR